MARRRKMKYSKSRKHFKNHAGVNRKNRPTTARGGIWL